MCRLFIDGDDRQGPGAGIVVWLQRGFLYWLVLKSSARHSMEKYQVNTKWKERCTDSGAESHHHKRDAASIERNVEHQRRKTFWFAIEFLSCSLIHLLFGNRVCLFLSIQGPETDDDECVSTRPVFQFPRDRYYKTAHPPLRVSISMHMMQIAKDWHQRKECLAIKKEEEKGRLQENQIKSGSLSLSSLSRNDEEWQLGGYRSPAPTKIPNDLIKHSSPRSRQIDNSGIFKRRGEEKEREREEGRARTNKSLLRCDTQLSISFNKEQL